MRFLFVILLSQVLFVRAQHSDSAPTVLLKKSTNDWTDPAVCNQATNGLTTNALLDNKYNCRVKIDTDNQKTTDYDFMSSTTIQLPTQIGGCNIETDRCVSIDVQFPDDVSLDQACQVSKLGDIEDRVAPSPGTATITDQKIGCTFSPRNDLYLGKVDYVVKFTRSNPNDPATNQFIQVKISVEFIPAQGAFGTMIEDDTIDSDGSLGQFVFLAGASNLPDTSETETCTATDGIESSGLNADNDTPVHTSNHVVSNGACPNVSPGTLPYFFKDGQSALIAGSDKSASQIDSYDGVAVEMRLLAHFLDKRYKIASQSGVEALENNIGSFKITASGLAVHSDYSNFKGTPGRDDVATVNLALRRLDFKDYGTGACTLTDGTTSCDKDEYAQYRFDHKHVLRYRNIKHIQSTYLRCDNGCDHKLIVEGFGGSIVSNVAVDVNTVIPKANWNIYILKLRVRARNGGVSSDLSSNPLNPQYGLPVLPTLNSPQHPDGIPLSYLYELYELSGDRADNDRYDQVDSYDDGYELFARLRIASSNSNYQEQYMPGAVAQGIEKKCSSNRFDPTTPGSFGEGLARNLARNSQMQTVVQKYFDDCRIHVTAHTYMDQIVLAWDEDINNVKPYCCVPSDTSATQNIHSVPTCGGDLSSTDCNSRSAVIVNGEKIRLTVVDRRKIKIGSTELSLLRRKEIAVGHGVDVKGSKVIFIMSKEDQKTDTNLKFDIWGTQSMAGYDTAANPCSAIGGSCSEIHGCSLLTNGIFDDDQNDPNCGEKSITLLKTDNEYQLHEIRSTSQCNGKMDVQFRSADGPTGNLLGATGNLRPTYDVRFPCSRVSNSVKDSIKLKFHFAVHYSLAEDELKVTMTGNSDLETANAVTPYQYASGAEGSDGGFTEKMEMQAFLGTCSGGDHSDSVSTICSTETTLTTPASEKGVVDSTFDASSCDDTKLASATVNGANVLTTTFSLGMLYKRTFGYVVDRDHQLDPLVDDTAFSSSSAPSYFCRDQSFTISVNAEKTASVSVTTPVQIMMERMAQINEVSWLAGNGANGCSSGSYKLVVKVGLQEQNVQASNDADQWLHLDSLTISEVNGFAEQDTSSGSISGGDRVSKIELHSECIAVTEQNGGCQNADLLAFTSQVHTTTLTVSASDANLGPLATGVPVVSNLEISVQFDECPLDSGTATQEDDEFDIKLSFENPTGCLDDPNSPSYGDAFDTSGNLIANCNAALVTSSGSANLHGYMLNDGSRSYIDGAEQIGTGDFLIDTATFKLKRFDKLLGGGKGDELSIGGSTGGVLLCNIASGTRSLSLSDPELVLNNAATKIVKQSQGTSMKDAFKCEIDLQGFGVANMLDDIFEIHVVATFTNGDARRRLRTSHELKLGASAPKNANVGFRVVSGQTEVVDDFAAHPAKGDVAKENETPRDDTMWMILVISAIVGAVLLLAVLVHCTGAITVPQVLASRPSYQPVQREEPKKYTNLRY